jgi:hypothetical protein
MSDKAKLQAKRLFREYKYALIASKGDGALDEYTIQKIGKKAFGTHWGGVVPRDRVKIAPNRYYVVNTSAHGGKGMHWVALYTSRAGAWLYDSYNRPIRRLLPHLVKSIERHGYHLEDTSHAPDQIGHESQTCGDDALAFLMTVHKLGIRAAQHV